MLVSPASTPLLAPPLFNLKIIFIGFCFLILLISSVTLQLALPVHNDFFAYFRAAERWMSGISPYQNEVEHPFKYLPVTLFYFVPFALLPYEVSKWVFLVVHYVFILCVPVIAYKILNPQKKLIVSNLFLFAWIAAFTASFRFIEIEFRAGQIGLIIEALLFLGAYWLSQSQEKTAKRVGIGMALIAAGAMLKVHTFLVFALFLKNQSRKSLLVALPVLALFFLLPYPSMWLDWINQIRNTTPYASFANGQYVCQGIYGFAKAYLNMESASALPMVLLVPYLLVSALWLPRFRFEEIPEKKEAFLLSLSAMLLLGTMASPLPWSHTYSVLLGIVFASWLCANRLEKIILSLIVIFLGVTPSGIIGREWSRWLEVYQSIFMACSVLWGLLVWQARRKNLKPNKTG